nr:immunoglobulin heavy chain junction region [Macaca mulatta]MOW83066.1 immunoglobulin heavy chain junction region [Macaca mulatta]
CVRVAAAGIDHW